MGRTLRLRALLVAVSMAGGLVVAMPSPIAAAGAGTVWSSLNSGSSTMLWAVACAGSATCYLVGESGTVIVTRNGGASWSTLPAPTANRLQGISCPTELTCFTVGPVPPTLLRTVDGGNTWADISAGVSQSVGAISCPGASTCWTVGAGGAIFDTKDAGATWRPEGVRTRDFLSGVSCPTTSTCFAVGEQTIERTTDGGNSWYQLDPLVPHSLQAVSCSSETHCVAVGPPRLSGNSTVLTTFNGGATWAFHDVPNVQTSVTCIGSQCFAVGNSGWVVGSGDGGTTWAGQSQSTSNPLDGIGCLTAAVCFAVGGSGTLLASPAGPRTVTNANDSGPGSLRAAMDYANGHYGLDTITFGIGTGPRSIAPQSGLPVITDPAIVDASTQPGYTGAPIIELNGSSAGVVHGLSVSAGSSTVRGFVINRFQAFGVWIGFGGGNTVAGNYIGTDASGTSASPNLSNGVAVVGHSTGNLIGGPSARDRNVISANGDKGVVIAEGSSAKVQGNYLGTDVTGNVALPNRYFGVSLEPGFNSRITGNLISGNGVSGVNIISGSSGNVVEGNRIGTNAAGTAAVGNGTFGVLISDAPDNTVGRGNTISGNGNVGVAIFSAQSAGDRVVGNLIGTDVTGTSAIPNGDAGVSIAGADHNTIGGTDGADRNVISGNANNGVRIGASANTVAGNYIGLGRSGTTALGNGSDGVFVYAGSSNVIGPGNVVSASALNGINLGGAGTTQTIVQGNYIGTDATGHSAIGNALNGIVVSASPQNTIGPRNLLSGNVNSGLLIYGTTGTGNVVTGNLAGTDVTGTAALPNQWWGIVFDGAPGNTIRGNVASGNAFDGVLLNGTDAHDNVVQSNLVGLDITGTHAVPNSHFGINVSWGAYNTIGGPSAGNVVGGNGWDGIRVFGASAHNTTIQGNRVGTDVSGRVAIGNGSSGVTVADATDTLIGGTDTGAGNLVSANTVNGVNVYGGASARTVIQSNYVGTDVTGSRALGNGLDGIQVQNGPNNTVAGNLVSGNVGNGVEIDGANATVIQGNLVGTDATGAHALGNGNSGIAVQDATDVLVGGTAAGARNVASGNRESGIFVGAFFLADPSMRTLVEGNYVGTDVTGGAAVGNGLNGVTIVNATGNYVGGTAAGSGNLVSGNANNGIEVDFSAGPNYVQGNLIGTDRTGRVAVANGAGPGLGTFGVWIGFSAGSVISGNTIAGNNSDGIALFGDATTRTQVQANFIGVDVSGTHPLGNHGNGIIIDGNASGNAISGNVIGNNDFNGIVVWFGVRDSIRANTIYSNGGLGIDLNNDGVTLNDRGDSDGGANNSQNFPVLSHVVGTPTKLAIEGSIDTPNPQTVTIEIYANASPSPGADFSGYGEGQTLIATVKPNASGHFAVVLAAVPKGTVISATATDSQGNTSEFALDKTT